MKLLIAAALALGLAGCAATGVEEYRATTPVLKLEHYFNGRLEAWGMFQGRSGEVKKRFHVVIDARWNGNFGVLDEHFRWSDGTESQRIWTLIRQPDGSYRGKADDVIGEAIGKVAGNALHWRYVMAVPVDGKTYHVAFDDWMFLMDDKVMLNRSTMSKWGFHLGEVTLSFIKR
jgi:hypothetical protein